MKSAPGLLLWLAAAYASQAPQPTDPEQEHLGQLLAEAGTSQTEFIRALEKQLAQYPQSERRLEYERAIVRAAIEIDDTARILRYGERVLEKAPGEADLLERVARALLSREDPQSSKKALAYARRLEEVLRDVDAQAAGSGRAQSRLRDELDQGLARALVFQARALGNLDQIAQAVSLAKKSYGIFPSAESAREAGRWLARTGNLEESVRYYAEALVIDDPRNTASDRAKVRVRMGEIYRQWKGSEAGLGDLVLAAMDRTAALLEQRRTRLRQLDPNRDAVDPLDFTLSGLNGDSLAMRSLAGKVVVMDFWATWCGPCRAQKPLYDEVKRRFQGRTDVVFLAVNTDEDRGAVEPFLDRYGWNKQIYFEDGLSRRLRVTSIPTTVVFGKQGRVFTRIHGFIPERFVDQLTERIQQALVE